MSHYDLIVRGGRVVTATGIPAADVAIADGRIVAVEPEIEGTGDAEIDAAGLHVFPGLIDPHVHFNEPGRTDWEGFATGSRALAAGGATTVFDMPLNAHPPTVDGPSFDQKLAAAKASSVVDFALWGGLVPGSVGEMEALAERGVIGFKAFMSRSGTDDFPAADDATLYEGMAEAVRLGLPVAVHAENDGITNALARRLIAEGRTSPRDYMRSRPIVAELEAIGRAITFAEETGCSLHVVHVSTGRGVALVAEAGQRGVAATCETCPQVLVMTEKDLERLGAVAKCAPPLRPQAEQDALWDHLLSGTLPMVSSDHSPAPPGMKTADDFFEVWGGISGGQSTLQLMLTAGYGEREMPLPALASVCSENAARRFGLSRKGRISPGMDADLALIDLQHDHVLEAEDLFYRHKHSPYVGRGLKGRVASVLVRGNVVFDGGETIRGPVGRLVRPAD